MNAPNTRRHQEKIHQLSEAALTNYQTHLTIIQHLSTLGAMSTKEYLEASQSATRIWECNKGLIEAYKSLLSE